MATYSDPNLEEDIFNTAADPDSNVGIAVETGEINRMPTTLPGSLLTMPQKPETLPPLDLTDAMLNMDKKVVYGSRVLNSPRYLVLLLILN